MLGTEFTDKKSSLSLLKAQQIIADIIGKDAVSSIGNTSAKGKIVSASLKIKSSPAEIDVSLQCDNDIIVVPLSRVFVSDIPDHPDLASNHSLSAYVGCEGIYKLETNCLIAGLVLQNAQIKALVLIEQEGMLEDGDWDTLVVDQFEVVSAYSEWKQSDYFFSDQ